MHLPLVIALLIQLLPLQFICMGGGGCEPRQRAAVSASCGECADACPRCQSCPRTTKSEPRQVPTPAKTRNLADVIPALLTPPTYPAVHEASHPQQTIVRTLEALASATHNQRQSTLGVWLN